MIAQKTILSPVGELTLTDANGAIVSLNWGAGRDQASTQLLEKAAEQLHAYFDGTLKTFDLPLSPPVSNHGQTVLNAMQKIGYGETATYAHIAGVVGSSPRAVGGACGRNPIPIIIPCHRVLSAAGMGGYSGEGGLETKRALLALEGALQRCI
ncbi:MAG: methylated-DNA--[protein]-cysteine S-methyltransferase [Pseudomonadota bacterium]